MAAVPVLASRVGRDVALATADGLVLWATHVEGPSRELVIVVAHGFTGGRDRPGVRRIVERFAQDAGVLALDFRGHGRSAGLSTVGDVEVLDLRAAVETARRLGYRRVATVGFSMGGSVAVRHAALYGGVDAVVTSSGPARWFERGTPAMRRVHWMCESSVGRRTARRLLHTRIATRWDVIPDAPVQLVGAIAPTPLLIVHGDRDAYFPLSHPRALRAAAGEPSELWIIEDMGHGEDAMTPRLQGDVAGWIARATRLRG